MDNFSIIIKKLLNVVEDLPNSEADVNHSFFHTEMF